MTRMWCVETSWMCRNHLLGEHKEIHQLVGSINKNKSIKGYIEKGLVDTRKIFIRHDKIVKEMLQRGYNHNSSIPAFINPNLGKVDINKSREELINRCEKCKELANKLKMNGGKT